MVDTVLHYYDYIDTLSVGNYRNRRRGTIGQGARQLASLSSVDENALSSGNQTNTEDKDSEEEEGAHQEDGSQDKPDVRWVHQMTTDKYYCSTAYVNLTFLAGPEVKQNEFVARRQARQKGRQLSSGGWGMPCRTGRRLPCPRRGRHPRPRKGRRRGLRALSMGTGVE